MAGFGFAFLTLLSASVASYWSIHRLIESQGWVMHTDEVLGALAESSEQLAISDQAQQNYSQTQNQRSLRHYQTAVQTLQTSLKNVRHLTQDNPRQQQKLNELDRLVFIHLKSMQQGIESLQNNRVGNASQNQLNILNERDEIELKLDEVMAEEKKLLQQRVNTVNQEIRPISVLAGVGYGLSLGLVMLTYALLRRQQQLTRRLSEEALRLEQQASQAKVATLLESVTDAFVALDPDWRYVYVNQRAAQLFNRQPEDLIGKHIWTEFPEGVGQPFYHAYYKAIAQQKMMQLEEYYPPWDRWYENRIYPSESGLSIFFQDITPRKRSEIELQQSEERYRALVEATAQFVWTATKDGFSPETQPGWQALTGQSPQEIAGWGWLNALHPDDQPHVYTAWSTAVQQHSTYETQFRIVTQAGEYRHFSVRGVPVFEADGSVREWIGTCTDITETERLEAERQQAELELRRAKAELEQKVGQRTAELQTLNLELQRSNQELEQFAYVTSHDLQEPLRAITNYCQLLEEEYETKLDDVAQSYLSIVLDGAQHMRSLILDLLAYSRVATQTEEVELVDCNVLLQQALNHLQVAIAESAAQITYDALPTVKGNPVQLIQLFQNLISNALKFSQQHPEIHIGVEHCKEPVPHALFWVRDRGIGMQAQYLDRIFEVFRRLHMRREFPGTGIGLAICKKIVERHHGTIWATSEPGVGTTFYFTLTAVPSETPSLK